MLPTAAQSTTRPRIESLTESGAESARPGSPLDDTDSEDDIPNADGAAEELDKHSLYNLQREIEAADEFPYGTDDSHSVMLSLPQWKSLKAVIMDCWSKEEYHELPLGFHELKIAVESILGHFREVRPRPDASSDRKILWEKHAAIQLWVRCGHLHRIGKMLEADCNSKFLRPVPPTVFPMGILAVYGMSQFDFHTPHQDRRERRVVRPLIIEP